MIEKRQEAVLQGHTSFINSVAVTRDNKFIISGSGTPYDDDNNDYRVRVWNVLQTRQENFIKNPVSYVNSVVTTYDYNFVVFGGDDKCLRVWNLLDNKQV